MTILRVQNLTRTYGQGNTQVEALKDVSFSVRRGEFVALMGPSGSGKSTLLHILGGIDPPDHGKVFVDGTDIYQLKDTQLAIFRRRQIGLIYQFGNLLPTLSVEENIALPLLLDGRDSDPTYITEMLKLLNLSQQAHQPPTQLSGGQQQRVSIGRALISTPALVLADEPTGSLDRKNSADIMELFRRCNRQFKQTLIIITHDSNIALQADRLLTMEDGRIIQDEVIRP